MTHRYTVFAILLSLAFVLGCNSGKIGQSGKVTFADDGSPLTVGTVCFATPTFQAKGDVNKDGTFSMGSIGAADGLPPGTYNVGILGATEDLGGDVIYSILDPKWASPSTSGYKVTVEKTTKNLEIKVDRNPVSRDDFKAKSASAAK